MKYWLHNTGNFLFCFQTESHGVQNLLVPRMTLSPWSPCFPPPHKSWYWRHIPNILVSFWIRYSKWPVAPFLSDTVQAPQRKKNALRWWDHLTTWMHQVPWDLCSQWFWPEPLSVSGQAVAGWALGPIPQGQALLWYLGLGLSHRKLASSLTSSFHPIHFPRGWVYNVRSLNKIFLL